MIRRFLYLFSGFFILIQTQVLAAEPVSFKVSDRVLVLAAHPDDETLGVGGVIQKAVNAGAEVKIVYLTHGDQNEMSSLFYQKKPLLKREDFLDSGRLRKREAIEATKLLGVPEQNLIFLGYPDFGSLGIWKKHWGEKAKPYRSLLTRVNKVLYKEDATYGRYYKGENVVADMAAILSEYKPTQLFVPAPYDLNTDHQAAFLFLNAAYLNVKDSMGPLRQFTYLVHYPKWPQPRRYEPGMRLEIPDILIDGNSSNWMAINLSDEEIQKKFEALSEYKSQLSYSKKFLLSFVRQNEVFQMFKSEEVIKLQEEASAYERKNPERDILFFVENGKLVLDIRLSEPWDRMGVLNADVYGYSSEEDFMNMPKLKLRLFGGKLITNKGRSRLAPDAIAYELKKDRMLIRVPLGLLENPDHVFLCVSTAREDLSLDFGAWQLLKLN